MPYSDNSSAQHRTPWNKGKLIGAKPPLRPKHVWAIRTRLLIEGRTRDLAMFNLAIDSKLRGCDVVALKVEDIAPNGYAIDRAMVRQKKTGGPVKFELTDQTRQAVDDYLRAVGKKPGEFLLVEARKLSLVDSARLFALAAVAREDALIAVFDAKYHYEFWRPVTAIRNGDIDNNSATQRDAAWEPIDATPMHPEYPCAHCISSASLVGVMEVVFGTAEMPEVSIASPTAPGVVHRWTNVRAFSDEVSEARIWAGFHYRFSTKVGQDMGHKIGEYVAKNLMQPVAIVAR